MSNIFDTTTDEQAVTVMEQYGGEFIKNLARLWRSADPENRLRLTTAFRPAFDKYQEDFKLLKHYQTMVREAKQSVAERP